MPLPPLTTTEVNMYLWSIASDHVQLEQLCADLEINIVNAVTSRFAASPWQIDRINAIDASVKTDMVKVFRIAVDRHASIPTTALEGYFTGITDMPTGSPTNGFLATASGWTQRKNPDGTPAEGADYEFGSRS